MKRYIKSTSGKNTVSFRSAEDIYDVLVGQHQDLYCTEDETYMFEYNAIGAIAYYRIDMGERMSLASQAKESGEDYISALLGPGGYIIDVDEGKSEVESTEDIMEFLDQFVGKEFLYANVKDLV